MSSSKFVPLSARGTTAPEEISQGAVKRKWRASSSSYDGPVWSVGKGRIGFPQPLPKLPISIEIMDATKQEMDLWRSCRDDAVSIITDEGISFKEVGVYQRKGAGDERPTPTLLISLRGDMDLNLATSALVTIGHMLKKKKALDLRVEIAAPGAYAVETIFPIDHDHPLVKLWPRKIRSKVLDLLEFVKFCELGVYNYGFTAETAVPTIVLTVINEAHNIREDLKTAMKQACSSHGVQGMNVAVMYDEVKLRGLRDQGYREGYQSHVQRPGMGYSIGIDNIGAGTLGGYIVLVDPRTQVRRHVFLTCWHVLRPNVANLPPGFDAGTTAYGQWPQPYPQPDEVHSPSRRHLNDEITELDVEFNELQTKDSALDIFLIKEEAKQLNTADARSLAAKRAHIQRNRATTQASQNVLQNNAESFGRAKIASGYRIKDRHTLDWAIGEPLPQRRGENLHPSQQDLDKLNFQKYNLQGPRMVDVIDLTIPLPKDKGKLLYKQGAITGLTDGYYNGIDPTVDIPLPNGIVRRTIDHCIISRAGSLFSQPGDSGAWVFDEAGRLVGMLWGGRTSVSYFTPIAMVFSDIELRTGWRVELP